MSKFPINAQYRTSEAFGKRLKTLMYENDFVSNQQFAEFLGVSVPVIAKAVNFGIVPSTRMLIRIADKLNISFSYLIGVSDENDFMESLNRSDFTARIADLTEEKNMNFGQLASKMDFPRTYFYEWVKENTLPSVDYVLEISEYFDVTPDYILGRTDYRK